jgi:hypothetical protein
MAPGLQGLSERDGKGVAPIGLIGNHRHQIFDLVEATRATMPNSAKWPRNALTSIVRCRTRRSWTLCATSAACCCGVLTGTKRMEGRRTASPTSRTLPSPPDRWQGSKKGDGLATAQAPAQNNFPGSVNPVQLEIRLRNVDTDGNLADGWLPLLVICDDHRSWHKVAVRGPPTPSVWVSA